MTEATIRSIVGWIIIIGHLMTVGLAVILLTGKLDEAQLRSILLTLGPVATAYFAAVVTSFLCRRAEFESGPRVNLNFAAIAVILPTLFVAATMSLVATYPSTLAGNIESLQQWIAGIEIALGGTVGFLIAQLFPAGEIRKEGV